MNIRFISLRCWSVLIVSLLATTVFAQPVKNGFDLVNSSVPAVQILSGGPPRDGIPAIDNPFFDAADDANWLDEEDWVIGVAIDDEARVYPLRILNWHEIVNDRIADMDVLVTFCPLCGTGIVFEPPDGARTDFGVSGLLYNSDVLLYDRETESLWSQILATAVSGERVGAKLKVVPSLQTKWGNWRKEHPQSMVLNRMTGHRRNYDVNPYSSYLTSRQLIFPVANQIDDRLHPKERVIGINLEQAAKAYPFSVMQQQGESRFEDTVADTKVVVHYDADGPAAWIEDVNGARLASTDGFWFAWYAFYPESEVYAIE